MDGTLAADPVFDMGFADQGLIQENAYCRIWWALEDDERIIVKTYRGTDTHLARQEAEALDLYHAIVESDDDFVDSRCLGFDGARNLLRIAFVQGECLTDLVYRGRGNEAERRRAVAAFAKLGRFSRRLWERTKRPGGRPSPFLREYLEHASRRLASFPVLGRLLFGGLLDDVERLWQDLVDHGEACSYCHGDMVMRNAHVDGDRLGLIDFANALPDSHVLNDAYNLHLALANTWLPAAYKRSLWEAYAGALDLDAFPRAVHAFYRCYHRRRWMQLKLWAMRPWPWFQAARGLATFARCDREKTTP